MLLIPLGFGNRIPQIPWMTIAITAVICVISIPYFDQVAELDRTRVAAEKEGGYHAKLVQFAEASCPKDFSAAECKATQDLTLIFSDHRTSFNQDSSAVLKKLIAGKDEVAKSTVDSMKKVTSQVKVLIGAPTTYPETMKAQAGFEELVEIANGINAQVRAAEKAGSFLTPANKGFKQLSLAQWTHGGWSHLLGNLFVFLVLAALLEARMGSVAFLGLYLVGGTLGLLAQVLLMKDPTGFLLGASANISAVTGGFFVFFFRRPMKVLFTMVIYNRLIDCPTWLMIPVLFVLNDISGAVRGGAGVAHVAHLVGFVSGAALAWLMKENDGLGPAYIYPIEYNWHVQMRGAEHLQDKLMIAELVAKYNPANYAVLEEALREITDSAAAGAMPDPGDGEARKFLESHLARMVANGIERKDLRGIERILNRMPPELDMVKCLEGLNQKHLVGLGERQLKQGNWYLAMRLYDAFRFHFPTASGAPVVEKSIRGVLTHVRDTGADLAQLAAYRAHAPTTTFQNLLNEFAPDSGGGLYERAG